MRENTPKVSVAGRMTYTEMANMSMNQVLMRSINTSLTALLPVLSILVVGAWIMGAATLEEFGLALLVGLLAGAYSSIFIATPDRGLAEGARAPVPPGARAPRPPQRVGGRPTAAAPGRPADELVDVGSVAAGPAAATRAPNGAPASAAAGGRQARPGRPLPSAVLLSHPPRPRKKGARR